MPTDYELAVLANHVYKYGQIVVGNARAQVDKLDEYSVASIAGTDDAKDMAQNLSAIPWRPREIKAWVHLGFWRYFKQVMEPILVEIYQNGKPVICTGHSLGGVAAGYLAAVCIRKGIPVARLVTFGAPRGGYSSYGDLITTIEGERYVRDGDQVPWVPPPGIFFPWRHDRDEFELIGASGFIDHPMDGYVGEMKILKQQMG